MISGNKNKISKSEQKQLFMNHLIIKI